MDDFGAFILILWLTAASSLAGVFLVGDFRLYSEVYKQCEKQGYVQNTNTRIKCAVEKQ